MKKKILISILIVVSIALLVLLYFKYNEKVSVKNINDTVTINGIKISNSKLEYKNKLTSWTADIKSEKKDLKIKYIEVTIHYNKNEYKIKGYVGKELKKGKSTKVTGFIDENIEKAVKVSYKIVK